MFIVVGFFLSHSKFISIFMDFVLRVRIRNFGRSIRSTFFTLHSKPTQHFNQIAKNVTKRYIAWVGDASRYLAYGWILLFSRRRIEKICVECTMYFTQNRPDWLRIHSTSISCKLPNNDRRRVCSVLFELEAIGCMKLYKFVLLHTEKIHRFSIGTLKYSTDLA